MNTMGTITTPPHLNPDQRQRLTTLLTLRDHIGLCEPLDLTDQLRAATWVTTGEDPDPIGLHPGEKLTIGADAARWTPE